MIELILGLVGALTGSGVCGLIIVILQRKWSQSDKLDSIANKLDKHITDDDERYIKQCRTRILRFNDELIRGIHHTKEHFGDVLDDITEYGVYCGEHKEFKNEKAVEAIANIKRVYRNCEKDNSFLRQEVK